VLENFGFTCEPRKIKIALQNIPLHGRFEVIRKSPYVVIDGAHNPSAVRVFINTLKETFPERRYHIIFGAMKDKNIKGMLKVLEKISRDFYFTAINMERAEKPEIIKECLNKNSRARNFYNVDEAYSFASNNADKHDVICITGSFYLIGEFLRTLV